MAKNIDDKIIAKAVKSVLKESFGVPSEEQHYISIMVPRIKSWMDEVYEDWGGIDAVSPEAITDFSNRNDYEETLDAFAHEFNVDREELRPMLNKAIEIAHNKLKEELLGEGIVDKFTGYTPEEAEINRECLRTGFGRSPEERNPAYAAAKKAAEERRKQRMMQKNNESIDETQHIDVGRNASNNEFANRWINQYAKPLFNNADKAIAEGNVEKMTYVYKQLSSLYNSQPIKVDARLLSAKQRIKEKAQEIVNTVQKLMNDKYETERRGVSESIDKAIAETLSSWKKSINEDSYSYNGLDRQAYYDKMGADLYAEQQKPKIYKKNITLFKKAYNQLYKEFSIIGTIKRKSPEAKEVFNGEAFLKFVEHTEGDTLYTPIWEKYGGEYLEMANTYLESYIIKFRRKLGMD